MLSVQEERQVQAVCVDRSEHQPALSSHQKFRKASALVGRIAGVLSEVSTAKFHDRMIVLDLLQRSMNGEEVSRGGSAVPIAPFCALACCTKLRTNGNLHEN